MAYNHTEYMLDIATKLKELLHTEESRKFYRVSGILSLEELLQNLSNSGANGYILIVEDNLDGRLNDNESAFLNDDQYYTFYVAKNLVLNDFDEREEVLKECKSIIRKIYSRMFRDRMADHTRTGTTGLRDLDRSKITYQTVGPFAENFHGIMTSFILSAPAEIKFNENDWEE